MEQSKVKYYTMNLMNATNGMNSKSIIYHTLVFVSYILCFVYLFKPNTEMIAVFLFFGLHIVSLAFIISSKFSIPALSPELISAWDITQIFNINYSEYSLGFIAINWVLLLFALYWLVLVYIRLYNAYTPFGKDVSFGNMTPLKESLFRYLIISTVFMWVFYIVQNTKQVYEIYLTKYRFINSLVVVLVALSMMNSIYAFTISKELAGNIHTIAHIS